MVVAERQRIELEIKETERVVNEVKSLAEGTEIYRSTGPVLYKTTGQDVVSSLEKYKADISERLALYQSQESALRAELERVRKASFVQPKLESDEES